MPQVSSVPRYQLEFPSFDDLSPLLAKLPVTFTDYSWHNDAGPRFEFPAESNHYPKLVLWVDHPDPSQREWANGRFLLTLWREEEDYCNGADEVLVTTDDIEDVARTILRVINDGISMRLTASTNDAGQREIHLPCRDMAITNPFLSDCGRFRVSPAQYGLTVETGTVFLNTMPMDQLRNVMSEAIGNTEVFDSLPSDQERREFAIDYLTEELLEGKGDGQ